MTSYVSSSGFHVYNVNGKRHWDSADLIVNNNDNLIAAIHLETWRVILIHQEQCLNEGDMYEFR